MNIEAPDERIITETFRGHIEQWREKSRFIGRVITADFADLGEEDPRRKESSYLPARPDATIAATRFLRKRILNLPSLSRDFGNNLEAMGAYENITEGRDVIIVVGHHALPDAPEAAMLNVLNPGFLVRPESQHILTGRKISSVGIRRNWWKPHDEPVSVVHTFLRPYANVHQVVPDTHSTLGLREELGTAIHDWNDEPMRRFFQTMCRGAGGQFFFLAPTGTQMKKEGHGLLLPPIDPKLSRLLYRATRRGAMIVPGCFDLRTDKAIVRPRLGRFTLGHPITATNTPNAESLHWAMQARLAETHAQLLRKTITISNDSSVQ